MSFILDALRKSDHRRRMETAPGLQTAHNSGPPRRGRRRGWLALGLVLLLTVVAGIVVFSQRDRLEHHWLAWLGQDQRQDQLPDSPEPALPDGSNERMPTGADNGWDNPDAARSATDARERREMLRERVVTDPAEASAEIERLVAERRASDADTEQRSDKPPPAVVDRRAPTNPRSASSVVAQAPERSHVRPPDPAEAERVRRQLLDAQQRREARQADDSAETGQNQTPDQAVGTETEMETASRQPPYSRIENPADSPAETSWTPQASEYVRAWELPLSIRRNMPALSLTIHVFAENLEDRFVLINGERFVTGDDLVDGARLVDIRREGAVVDYRDYRFLLEP